MFAFDLSCEGYRNDLGGVYRETSESHLIFMSRSRPVFWIWQRFCARSSLVKALAVTGSGLVKALTCLPTHLPNPLQLETEEFAFVELMVTHGEREFVLLIVPILCRESPHISSL